MKPTSKPEDASADNSAAKLAYSIKEFCQTASIGQTKAYELVRTGQLRTRKVGRHRIVLVADALALLQSLPSD
jgi:hypothetical protein